MFKSSALLALLSASFGSAQFSNQTARPASCQQPSGDFNITSFQLYPENLDFDSSRCRIYLGVLYDASVAVYDLAQKRVLDDIISIPNITNNPLLHASGIQYDDRNDRLSVMLNSGAAFDTQGTNTAGDNNVMSYDLKNGSVNFVVNLSNYSDAEFRGFQDMEHDNEGNIFVVGTFGGSLMRISADGLNVTQWWRASNSSDRGLSGAAKFNETTLLITDNSDSQVYRYSMTERNQRTKVELSGADNISADLDGIYMPPMYRGAVLLVSALTDTVVLRSNDGWATAERLGAIPNKFAGEQGLTTASVEAGGRILSIHEYFLDNGGTLPGNRSQFPVADITESVEELLAGNSPGANGTSGSDSDVPGSSIGGSGRVMVSWGVLGAAAGLAMMLN
ncbi:hypothetical protein G6O67_006076 [Ophiocordyceps sinensis]|uniref:Tri14-like protein n=1 Tax=Ophiocordyceps sinensis TaxID=72228 RepID=A0A8H4PPD3_9HYPO|nr:hypothetical protein G6O67_006076 [Ophiocordyceps sinensis]